jgi:hypothetical protein
MKMSLLAWDSLDHGNQVDGDSNELSERLWAMNIISSFAMSSQLHVLESRSRTWAPVHHGFKTRTHQRLALNLF